MTATTAEHRPTAQGHPQRWLILGVICLAQLTVLLDNTVLNVAIPSLTKELDASTTDIQWMINAYSLVQSGLLLTAGSAADLPQALNCVRAGETPLAARRCSSPASCSSASARSSPDSRSPAPS